MGRQGKSQSIKEEEGIPQSSWGTPDACPVRPFAWRGHQTARPENRCGAGRSFPVQDAESARLFPLTIGAEPYLQIPAKCT